MTMSSTMISVTPQAPPSRARLLLASLAIVAISAGGAAAQTSEKTQAANAQWRKLTQTEVDCVDKALRARDSSLLSLIRRGLGPLDPTSAKLRADCRAKAAAGNSSQTAAGTSATSQAKAPKQESSREPLRDHWTLNGATLSLIAEGDVRKFYELRSGGGARGLLLLEGKIQESHFVGTAYKYSSGCGRMAYRVDGMFRENNRRLELQGQSPRTDASCSARGTELASLTLKAIDSSMARARVAASAEARAETIDSGSSANPSRATVRNAATGNVQDEKVVTDSMPAEPPAKVTIDRAAAARPVAKKATADEPAPEKITPDKVVAENTDVMQIASVDKGAVAKPETGKTGATKTDTAKAEAARTAADNGAAEVVVPVIPIAARGVATDNGKTPDRPAVVKEVQNRFQQTPAANMPSAARPAMDAAGSDAERAKIERAKLETTRLETTRALTDGDIARKETATAIAAAISASVASEARLSFIYGLLSGMAATGALVLLFFALQRWRARTPFRGLSALVVEFARRHQAAPAMMDKADTAR